MSVSKSTITEREILSELEANDQLLPPLRIRLIRSEVAMGSRKIDALVEASWGDRNSLFGVEIKALSTPKALQASIDQILSADLPTGTRPMVVLPFLKEENLRKLEAKGVSGIDMCGNGVVISDNFSVFRSGQPNRYRYSSNIKNVYARNSSMIARAFLCKAEYSTVQAVLDEVNARNTLVKYYGRKPMSQSTVSKCLKALEEDLMITRTNQIKSLQAQRLLDELSLNYTPPRRGRVVSCKSLSGSEAIPALMDSAHLLNLPVMLTGLASVTQYAVMQRGDVVRVYCPNAMQLIEQSSFVEADRFADVEIFEVDEEAVYFDSREDQGIRFASPVQTYLELMTGDKRDKETAEQVSDFILAGRESSRS